MSDKSKRQFPRASSYQDRHGRRRWRFRRRGVSVELGTEYGTDDFIRRYTEAESRANGPREIGKDRIRPGTFRALAVERFKSPEFRACTAGTQKAERQILEPFLQKHGHRLVRDMRPQDVRKVLSEKAETPSAANNLRKKLRQLMNHAIALDWRSDNPVLVVKPYKIKSGGYHTWAEHEIEQFYKVHPEGSLAHLAMTLMLWTGAAKVDAVALGWQNIRDGRIEYRRRKTEGQGGDLIQIKIMDPLAAALSHLPNDAMTFLQTQNGRSRSPNGLGNLMRRWCDEAGLPDCSSHGLRKAIARRLAEAGASAKQIASVTGHRTLAEVQRYTDAADREQLSDDALDKLSNRTIPQQKVVNLHGKGGEPSGKPLKGRRK